MNKIIISVWITWVTMLSMPFHLFTQNGRQQWTEKEAWEWHERVGVIKGFNEPISAYPGMPRKQIFQKAAELGFNSVRFWIHIYGEDNSLDNLVGKTKQQITYIDELAKEADEFGLTISPVLSFSYAYYGQQDKEKAFAEANIPKRL